MNYGLYLAAGGAIDATLRQAVLTNTLVNSETVGFKPDMVFGQQRLPARLAAGSFGVGIDPQLMLEKLGGAPTLAPTQLDLTQGGLVATGNPLDLALNGQGFFVVQDGDGQLRLTRDVRFTMDANGPLVMANNGMAVLDVRNRPIRLDRGLQVEINARGDVEHLRPVVATARLQPPPPPRARAQGARPPPRPRVLRLGVVNHVEAHLHQLAGPAAHVIGPAVQALALEGI